MELCLQEHPTLLYRIHSPHYILRYITLLRVSKLVSPERFFPSDFSATMLLYVLVVSFLHATNPAYLIFILFDALIPCREEYQFM
jgi:hypothetical protein